MESQKTTTLGTPISNNWDPDWIDEVEATEKELGRRCCGAHAPDDQPCLLQSTHKNGRCRFHGGVKNIGAPKGNTNARIHGLYMRRLQQCGTHCPMWNSCPMRGKDILQIPESRRPYCVYEQEELENLRKMDRDIQITDDPDNPSGMIDTKPSIPCAANSRCCARTSTFCKS